MSRRYPSAHCRDERGLLAAETEADRTSVLLAELDVADAARGQQDPASLRGLDDQQSIVTGLAQVLLDLLGGLVRLDIELTSNIADANLDLHVPKPTRSVGHTGADRFGWTRKRAVIAGPGRAAGAAPGGTAPAGYQEVTAYTRDLEVCGLTSADDVNAIGLLALGALGDFEFDLLTFFERTEARRIDGRVVNEDVVIRSVHGNEAVALLGIEPFNGSLRHVYSSYLLWRSVPHGHLPFQPRRGGAKTGYSLGTAA
ncbi:hypothetical protein SDC9_111122 [bioreactor metagenome]|uniref:Uncharacterized protein n=1 Tax=bioreactor metagenome TaxID=1076179 RepID=A0A645BGG1_9ZZZZ